MALFKSVQRLDITHYVHVYMYIHIHVRIQINIHIHVRSWTSARPANSRGKRACTRSLFNVVVFDVLNFRIFEFESRFGRRNQTEREKPVYFYKFSAMYN